MTTSPYHVDAGDRLPRSLGDAIDAFTTGSLYRSVWGDEVVEYLTMLARARPRQPRAIV